MRSRRRCAPKYTPCPVPGKDRGTTSNDANVALWPLPPCPRGGIDFICAPAGSAEASWEARIDAQFQAARPATTNFIVGLAANLDTNQVLATSHSIASRCVAEASMSEGNRLPSESLASLVQHCAALERKGAAHDFMSMVALIQLVYKCARYISFFTHR